MIRIVRVWRRQNAIYIGRPWHPSPSKNNIAIAATDGVLLEAPAREDLAKLVFSIVVKRCDANEEIGCRWETGWHY